MYRLLIVDDEPWVLHSLIHSVDWPKNGFVLAGTATDGEEALAFMEEQVPDLVLTDIRMPVMGGLELIDQAHRRWPQMRFIILSGHAEFEYARKALASGVTGYCLKPVQTEEMTECLFRVRKELEEETLRRLEVMLTQEEQVDEGTAQAMLARLGADWDARDGMRVAVGPCRIGFPLLQAEQLFLLREAQLPLLEADREVESCIGCSATLRSANLLALAVAEAREARLSWFIDEHRGVRLFRAGSRVSLHHPFQALSTALSACDASGIRRALAQTEQALLEGGAGLRQIEACRLRLDAFLETESGEDAGEGENEPDTGMSLTEAYPSMHAMFAVYGDLLAGSFAVESPVPEGAGGETVRELMSYIAEHATERIALMELAERFHFSPGYLCRLVKRETGRTLTEHQTRLRLDMAAGLLRSSSLSVAEIAQRCGYQDYFYFARLFRKTFDKTPSGFRVRV